MPSLQFEHLSWLLALIDFFGAFFLIFVAVHITPEKGWRTRRERLQFVQCVIMAGMSLNMMWYCCDLLEDPRVISLPNLTLNVLLLCGSAVSAARIVFLREDLSLERGKTAVSNRGFASSVLSRVDHCVLVDGAVCHQGADCVIRQQRRAARA